MNLQNLYKVGVTAALLCGTAVADGGDKNQNAAFASNIIGSMPNQSVAGVPSGGAPWVVREGHAVVERGGKLKVEVKGLLIVAGLRADGTPVPSSVVGTTGPVRMVAASLVCNGMVAGSTAVAPLSAVGDSEMEGQVKMKSCVAPSVLVRIAPSMSATTAELGPFIALSGSGLGDDNSQDANDDRGRDANGHDKGDDHGGK